MNHGIHGMKILTLVCLGMLLGGAATAATSESEDFMVDLSGMGPWEMRTARASETISYSTEWATNALTGANAVVKVYPAKREKPVALAVAGWIGSP